jgi:hypothetical protein
MTTTTTQTTTTPITIEKLWDENERTREASNGRVYVSTAGRWQWHVLIGNECDSTHDTRGAAADRVATIRAHRKEAMDAAEATYRAAFTAENRAAYQAAYAAYWAVTELPKARGYASRAGQRQYAERRALETRRR